VTESNADLVRDAFERWNSGDRESLLADIDPEVEIHVASAQLTGGDAFHGHQGYRDWHAAMEESFEVWQIHPDVFHDLGDRVVALGRMELRGRSSGVELDQQIGWLVHVRDGKMTRFQTFLSHEEALAAGGIS
jgi:ketosteroid isomerase-like protein